MGKFNIDKGNSTTISVDPVTKVERIVETVEVVKEVKVEVPVEVIKEVKVEVPIEVVKEVIKEVKEVKELVIDPVLLNDINYIKEDLTALRQRLLLLAKPTCACKCQTLDIEKKKIESLFDMNNMVRSEMLVNVNKLETLRLSFQKMGKLKYLLYANLILTILLMILK